MVMRAAEILVGLLLGEAAPRVIAVGFGPNVPKEGVYAGGMDTPSVIKKVKNWIGVDGLQRGATDDDVLSVLLLRGFSLLLRTESGQIKYYGPPMQVSEQIVLIYGLKSGTPVQHFTRKPAGGLNSTMSNAAAVLNVT